MNTSESSASRWFVGGVSGAMLSGFLAAMIMLAPAPRTLAQGAVRALATLSVPRFGKTQAPTVHRVAAALPAGTVIGPLNGELTPRANAMRRAIAVTIDNYFPDARPQSGISDASMVFETLVEGGYTRLMAVYLEHDPAVVGPVRSTRIYFDDWAAAYHAMLVHVGGNDDADAELWQMRPVYNLDEGSEPFMLSYSTPYFWRTAARSTPDNMYANIAKLRAYGAARGQDWRYSGAALSHKTLEPASRRGPAGTLTISFVDPLFAWVPANPDYRVQYRFDPASDSYIRVVGGTTQVDAATHRAIRARNIVVMHTGAGTPDLAAGTTVDAVSIPVIGSGAAEYYRDGRVEHGTWRQKDPLAPLQLLDRHGRAVRFNPGQTWVEVLPRDSTAVSTAR